MNSKETYGVQLDLLTQNYNKKLKDAVSITETQAKLIEQKAKVNFTGYSPKLSMKSLNMDLQSKEIENYQNQIKTLLSDFKMGKIDTSQAKVSLNELLNEIEKTNTIFNKYTHTRIKINVDDSELSLLKQAEVNTNRLDKYVQITTQDLNMASNSTNQLEKSLGDASNETKKLSQNMGNTSRNASVLGQNFEKTMNKGVGSTKRLLLSLFSVHSIWSLISRASNNALTINEGINSRVNILNSALGNMVLPIVQKVVGYLEYAVIFGAKIIQFFTGYNALANLTTSNIKNATKSAKELNKTLAGFDEITNINQSSKGSLAGGLKNDIKALDEFYKKIEEVENWMNNSGIYNFLEKVKNGLSTIWKAIEPLWNYALKPLLNFAMQHPEILTILFGVFLGNQLKNGIANILGNSNSGLLGVQSILGKLASIGIIGISIKVAYTGIKEAINAIEETNKEIENMAVETEKSKEKNNEWKESLKEMNSESETFQNLLKVQRSELDLNMNTISGLVGSLDGMSNSEKIVGLWLQGNNSQYSLNNRLIKENSEKIEENIRFIFELINSKKMDNQETEYFIQNIKQTITKLEEQKEHLSKNSKGYEGLQSAVDFAKESLNQYEIQLKNEIEALEKESERLEKNSNEYKQNQEEIQKAKDKLESLKNGNYDTNATINLDADTSSAKKEIKNFYEKIAKGPSTLLGAGMANTIDKWLSSFDVGTNYVPNDQLAMVHKGEMIIPAKYNPATSGIHNGHDEEIIEAIHQLKETLENKEMNAYISEDTIGRASSNFRSRRSRQLGKDVG